MDNQQLFNVLFAMVGVLGGWWMKAMWEAAKKLAEAKTAEDKRIKENSDHEYQIALAGLRADNQRLRDARAGSRIVPAAPAGSRSPGLACFDRADLDGALRRLDAGISGLIEEGDADAVGLNAGRGTQDPRGCCEPTGVAACD